MLHEGAGSVALGQFPLSHLEEVGGNLFPWELHREVFYTVGEMRAARLWGSGRGNWDFLSAFGDQTLRRFSGDRCPLAPALQGAAMEHRGCSLASYSWEFSPFMLMLEIGKNWS